MKEPDLLMETTVAEAREWLDNEEAPLMEKLTNVLDEAQGKVHGGDAEEATILITVKK